jgi:hypothetical protein
MGIKANDIFDCIHRLPDGISEGNETGALIKKYSKFTQNKEKL